MAKLEYRLGKDFRQSSTPKQRVLANLYKLPILSRFVKKALKKSYNLGATVSVTKGFHCETAFLSVGEHTGISNLWIHGTGEVNIGCHCSLSEGCKIITGSHYVWVSTGSSIMQGVTIGRGAVIGAFSVVKANIPPYAIVSGNPCKVVGFRYTPEEAVEFEKTHVPEERRIPLDKLQKNYEKYFLKRIKEIKNYVSI